MPFFTNMPTYVYGDGNPTCTLVRKFYKKGLVGHQTMQAIVTDLRKLGNVRVQENTRMKKQDNQFTAHTYSKIDE